MANSTTIDNSISTLVSGYTGLRAELVALVTDCDTARIPTVMGTGCLVDARLEPSVLRALIKGDQALMNAIGDSALDQNGIVLAVCKLMEEYGDQCAKRAISHAQVEVTNLLVRPAAARALSAHKMGDQCEGLCKDLQAAVLRMPGSGVTDAAGKVIQVKYEENLKFVELASTRLSSFDNRIVKISAKIAEITDDETSDATSLKGLQESRAALETEKRYQETALIAHFDAGIQRTSGGVKLNLAELVIPNNLAKGKGKELAQNIRSYLHLRAPFYYAIMPDVIRTLEDSLIGKHHVPPNLQDGFLAVNPAVRGQYITQALRLWEELELKVPKDVIANIRKTFSYGVDEKKACCAVGDGPMAIFCMLALFRPNGVVYREGIKDKLEAAMAGFQDGSNPRTKIKELWPTLREALDMGVKLQWSRIGKPMVTILSERNNTFARVLAKYAVPGTVVDTEDSGVELDRMFSDIEQACKDMEDAGVNFKSVSVNGAQHGADRDSNGADCWFGAKCHREDCTFKHPKDSAKDASSKGKGGGGKSGGKGGKGKGSKGKGKGKGYEGKEEKDKTCKAEGCQAAGRGFLLCTTCHRKKIETGSIKLKDGTISQHEKTEKNANAAGFEDEEQDEDLFEIKNQKPGPLCSKKKAAGSATKRKEATDYFEHGADSKRGRNDY